MNRYRPRPGPSIVVSALVGLALVAGCKDPIAIQPSCLDEMEVGESDQLLSNVENPGAIAMYRWRIFTPDSAKGEFDDPLAPNPVFTALAPGTVILRLAASDGLWEAISECTTVIVESTEQAVDLDADPRSVQPGETVTLTCVDIGAVVVVSFSITQTDGSEVELVETDVDGVVEFDAPEPSGDLQFQCVGTDEDDNESDPSAVTVTVEDVEGEGEG